MQIMKNSSTATSSKPDAHAGAERDAERGERVALERGEGGAGVGDGVDADAEPGHAVGAEDAQDGGQQNDNHVEGDFAGVSGCLVTGSTFSVRKPK